MVTNRDDQQLPSGEQQPSAEQPRKKLSNWTGFSNKTGWDWLQLAIQLLTALAIPIAIAVGTSWFSYQQNQTSLHIAEDQQQESTLQSYIDQISTLLLDKNLSDPRAPDAVREVARARTLTALRRLDATRKALLLRFLFESRLIGTVELHHGGEIVPIPVIISLQDADLSGAQLAGILLPGAGFEHANLSGADLSGTVLQYADFSNANLSGANLSRAYVDPAILDGADLSNVNLHGAFVEKEALAKAKSLKDTILPDGSTFPSKSWIIPGRDAYCVFQIQGHCSLTGK